MIHRVVIKKAGTRDIIVDREMVGGGFPARYLKGSYNPTVVIWSFPYDPEDVRVPEGKVAKALNDMDSKISDLEKQIKAIEAEKKRFMGRHFRSMRAVTPEDLQ
jgi:hypothetical protein